MLNTISSRLCFFILSLFITVLSLTAWAEEDFLSPEEAFKFEASMIDDQELELKFKIAPDYYMYRDNFEFHVYDEQKEELKAQDFIEDPQFPKGVVKYDPTFDREMEVFYDEVKISIPLKGESNFNLETVGQGCAEAGLCYPPENYSTQLKATDSGYKIDKDAGFLKGLFASKDKTNSSEQINTQNNTNDLSTQSKPTESKSSKQTVSSSSEKQQEDTETNPSLDTNYSLFGSSDTDLASWLSESGLLKIVLITFSLGLLLSLTPCVLPMLPILLSLVVGQNTQQKNRTRHNFSLTLMYVFGTSIVYTLLGIIAASLGAVLAVWIQNPWVLSIFAILLSILAIAMFGSFTFQTPTGVQSKLNLLMDKLPGGRHGSAFIMGIVSALIAGPCVAAPLAGVLLFISQTGNTLIGALALFALAWGQGISLIIIGTTSGSLIPKAGMWMERVKYFTGLLLLGTALWMVSSLLPNWLTVLGWAFLLISFALIAGLFDSLKTNILAIFSKALSIIAFIWAILLLLSIAFGQAKLFNPLEGIIQAQHNNLNSSNSQQKTEFKKISSVEELDQLLNNNPGKPVMFDFYADWCVSCHEMEAFTFNKAPVIESMNQMLLLQADVTKNTAEDRALLKRFNLFGPPGIIFFDEDGTELKQRVVGFQNAEKFNRVLQQVLNKNTNS